MTISIMVKGADEGWAADFKRDVENIVNSYDGVPAPELEVIESDDGPGYAPATCRGCGRTLFAKDLMDGLCEDCEYDNEQKGK